MDKPYVKRSERLDVLVESLEKAKERLQDSDSLTHQEFKSFMSELRRLVDSIREESAPFDDEVIQTESPMERFFRLAGDKLDDPSED